MTLKSRDSDIACICNEKHLIEILKSGIHRIVQLNDVQIKMPMYGGILLPSLVR